MSLQSEPTQNDVPIVTTTGSRTALRGELLRRMTRTTLIRALAPWLLTGVVSLTLSDSILAGCPCNYTPATWQREVDEIKNDLIDQRTDVVIAQMRAAGVFPSFDAPLFSQLGGQVPDGFHLTLSPPGHGAGGRISPPFNRGWIGTAPGRPDSIFVMEQGGRIYVFDDRQDVEAAEQIGRAPCRCRV